MQKRPPKASKNEMFVFRLCSTSDDWPSKQSDKSQPKCEKRPPKSSKNEFFFFFFFWIMFNFWWLAKQYEWQKSTEMQKRPPKPSKNEMFIFGLCSTSDDWPSNPSNESWQKCATEVPQNDLEWPISPDSQLFQSFPTKVAQDKWEQPISSNSQLFQSFPPKWLRMTQNGQFCMAKKKKNTMIQGNFYERLHFYTDNCAISPMASLLCAKSTCDGDQCCPPLKGGLAALNPPTPHPPTSGKSWTCPCCWMKLFTCWQLFTVEV